VQLIVGRGKPAFPHFIMTRRLPTKQLLRLGGLAMHVLKYLENGIESKATGSNSRAEPRRSGADSPTMTSM
jgi:hypothetical protein